MKKTALKISAFICCGIFISGISFGQSTPMKDSTRSEKVMQTEQEYINKSQNSETQGNTLQRSAAQDSIQLRISQDSTRLKGSGHHSSGTQNQKPILKDTSVTRTAPAPRSTEIQPVAPDKTNTKSTTTTPSSKPTEVKETKTLDSQEKKKVMYLVPDSTAKKITPDNK